MNIHKIIKCQSCNHIIINDKNHFYCQACQDDISRILKSKDISPEVKDFVLTNYSKYLNYLIVQNNKPEYSAEYHSFQDTCEEFYLYDWKSNDHNHKAF